MTRWLPALCAALVFAVPAVARADRDEVIEKATLDGLTLTLEVRELRRKPRVWLGSAELAVTSWTRT
jgi:hypothetical protein